MQIPKGGIDSMYTLYKTVDGQRQILGWYESQLDGAVAMDIYRSTFDDNSELTLEQEGANEADH